MNWSEAGREARQRAEQLAAKQNVEIERLEREEANVKRRDAPRGTKATVGAIAAGITRRGRDAGR